jgi:hypothetical protein
MTRPTLDPLTVKRLGLIRLLYLQGVDQTRRPEPLAFTCILSFHDAVELFLVLASEHLGATLPDRPIFMKYWEYLHPNKLTNGVDLAAKAGIDRLNRLRTAFKHAGALPGASAIEQAHGDVTHFFEDNTPRVFGIAFGDINMADVVPQADTRARLKEALSVDQKGDRPLAMAILAEALDDLVRTYIADTPFGASPLRLGRARAYPLRKDQIASIWRQPGSEDFRMPLRGAAQLADEFTSVREVALATRDAIRISILGLDYRDYLRFQSLTPQISSSRRELLEFSHPLPYTPNQEEFDFCYQFVVTVGLRISEHESQFTPPSWAAALRDARPPSSQRRRVARSTYGRSENE